MMTTLGRRTRSRTDHRLPFFAADVEARKDPVSRGEKNKNKPKRETEAEQAHVVAPESPQRNWRKAAESWPLLVDVVQTVAGVRLVNVHREVAFP